MNLYRVKIQPIAQAVIERLSRDGDIEVSEEHRTEAERDLMAIMKTFLKRDMDLREAVRDRMANHNIPYDQYGRIRGQIVESWNHPTGDSVEKYLSRQFVENFMITNFIDEVYADDDTLYRKTLNTIKEFDVDEHALREEARKQVKNATEGTVDFEIAFSQALKEVKRRHGLI